MKIKYSSQLAVGLIGIIVMIYVSLGVYGVLNANKLNDLYERSFKDSLTEGTFTDSAYSNILNIRIVLMEAIIGNNEEDVRAALNTANVYGLQIQSDFSRLRSKDEDSYDQNAGMIDKVIETFEKYEASKDKAFVQLNNHHVYTSKNTIKQQLLPLVEVMAQDLQRMVAGENEEVRLAYVDYKDVTAYVRYQMYTGLILVLSFLALAAIIIRRRAINAKEKRHLEQEELRIAIDSIGDGVIITDINKKVLKLNKLAEELTGWPSVEAKGRLIEEIFNIEEMSLEGEAAENPVETVLRLGVASDKKCEGILHSKEGIMRHISNSASPIKDIHGKLTGSVLIFHDITERRKREDRIRYITYHDQVTDLYNRSFYESQKHILDQDEYLPVSVIQGDINGLKLVNDAFGHARGDELLQEAATILNKCCRKSDYISRVGGDEFIILLPNTTQEEADQIIRRIEREVDRAEHADVHNAGFLSIALGAATKTEIDQSLDDVIKTADENMYKKKLVEQKSLHNAVLKSIISTLSEKSHETKSHGTRLVELSGMVGRELKLPREALHDLELLANLHDIGKIGIPDHILNKPGALTNYEWEQMKKHPEIGYRIAHSTAELKGIADYILYHHERWDGKGYPMALQGEQIPLLSRIITVVDAYDAMRDERPYKKSKTKTEALEEIERNSGTQFDPELVRLFVDKMR